MAGDILDGEPDFPTLIERARSINNWNQTEAGEHLEVTQGTISRWERGSSMPPRSQYGKIAEVLGISRADVGTAVARTDPRGYRTLRSKLQELEAERARVQSELHRLGIDYEELLAEESEAHEAAAEEWARQVGLPNSARQSTPARPKRQRGTSGGS